MTTDRDFDGIAMAWLADGPDELPDRVLDAVAAEIHTTRQRRPRVPWRYQPMSTPFRVGTAAVIGVLVIGGFVFLTRPGPSGVGGPGPSPSAIPSPATSPSAAASASPAATVPPLTQSFTSPRHGYTVHYPEGWTATPGTQSWVPGTVTLWGDPALDSIGSSDARLSIASQPLGAGQTADEWLVGYCHSLQTDGASCGPAITIGGQTGYVDEDGATASGGITAGGLIFDAPVVVDGRGYEFTLDGHVDRALFEALLASVTFDAAAAKD
jgi:hypothetical protein